MPTEVQSGRTLGFKAQQAARGIPLRLIIGQGGPTYKVLLENVTPDPAKFTISEETRDSAIVHVLRDDLGQQTVRVGDTFKDDSDNSTYRITRIEDSPINIAVRFHCEVVNA